MFGTIRHSITKAARKGFVGPYYSGVRGKLRFAFESLVVRRELAFVLERADFRTPPEGTLPDLTVVRISTLEELEQHRARLEHSWYRGVTDSWAGPLSWGERLYLGFLGDEPIAFNFVQEGTAAGFPFYWGRIFATEYRILRAGVAPSHRGQGVNKAMKARLLTELFAIGASRVLADCYELNVPTIRTYQAVGFRPIGRLLVLEIPGLRGFIRWSSLPSSLLPRE